MASTVTIPIGRTIRIAKKLRSLQSRRGVMILITVQRTLKFAGRIVRDTIAKRPTVIAVLVITRILTVAGISSAQRATTMIGILTRMGLAFLMMAHGLVRRRDRIRALTWKSFVLDAYRWGKVGLWMRRVANALSRWIPHAVDARMPMAKM